ncbi:hypothetical protein NC652_005410 [Populus alba x Populus x berolinensis]|nr:hypothetical protein NC652_005410 [Populus alba x Populus x berolinensis]
MGREQKVCTRNQQQPESSHMEKKASNSQHQIADGRRFPAVFHISISTCIKNAGTGY